MSNLHPAFVNEDFKASAKAAADTWLSSVQDALLSHYQTELVAAESTIRDCRLQHDALEKCLAVATSWARRQLGRKLGDSDLEESLQRIRALTPLIVADTQPPALQPAPLPTPKSQPEPSLPFRAKPQMRSTGVQTCNSFTTTDVGSPVSAGIPAVSLRSPVPLSARKKRPRRRLSGSPLCESQLDLFASPPPPLPTPFKRRVTVEANDQPLIVVDEPSLPTNTSTAVDKPQTPPTSQAPETSEPSTTTPSASVQLDLFGTPALKQKKGAVSHHLATCKENLVMGDSNLSDFEHPSCTIHSHANGRLSHFKALLTATKTSHDNVRRFFVCLSTLDSANSFTTNSTTLKSLLGAAHRVFPQAQAFVMLLGYDPSLPSDIRNNIQALNNFVITKHPSSCLHVAAPKEFAVTDHCWNSAARQCVYSKITDCLNYE